MRCVGWRNGVLLAETRRRQLLFTELTYDRAEGDLKEIRNVRRSCVSSDSTLLSLEVVEIRGRQWPVAVIGRVQNELQESRISIDLIAYGGSDCYQVSKSPTQFVQNPKLALESVCVHRGPVVTATDSRCVHVYDAHSPGSGKWLGCEFPVHLSGSLEHTATLACLHCPAVAALGVARSSSAVRVFSPVDGSICCSPDPCSGSCVASMMSCSKPNPVPVEYCAILTAVSILPGFCLEHFGLKSTVSHGPCVKSHARQTDATALGKSRDHPGMAVLFATSYEQVVMCVGGVVLWTWETHSPTKRLLWLGAARKLLVAAVLDDDSCCVGFAGGTHTQTTYSDVLAAADCDMLERGHRQLIIFEHSDTHAGHSGYITDGMDAVRFGRSTDNNDDASGAVLAPAGDGDGKEGYRTALKSLQSQVQATAQHMSLLRNNVQIKTTLLSSSLATLTSMSCVEPAASTRTDTRPTPHALVNIVPGHQAKLPREEIGKRDDSSTTPATRPLPVRVRLLPSHTSTCASCAEHKLRFSVRNVSAMPVRDVAFVLAAGSDSTSPYIDSASTVSVPEGVMQEVSGRRVHYGTPASLPPGSESVLTDLSCVMPGMVCCAEVTLPAARAHPHQSASDIVAQFLLQCSTLVDDQWHTRLYSLRALLGQED